MRRAALALALLAPLVALAALPPTSAAAPAGLDEGIQDLTKQIVPQVQKLGKKRIAVVDFAQLDGAVSDLGRYLAEELSAGLVLADASLRVVDRQHLARIIAEQKLSVVGVTEPGSVQKLGALAGADVLVTGSITGLDDRVRITAKLLSTKTAEIVGAAQTTVPDDGDIRTLAPNLSRGPVGAVPARVSPQPSSGAGPRRGVALADLPAVGGEPDLYDFTYVSKPVSIGGRAVPGGLVVFPSRGHAAVTYDLGARYEAFVATIGVPDTAPPSMRAVFRAFADGQAVLAGRAMRSGEPPVSVTVTVKGVRMLSLAVETDGAPSDGRAVPSALWGEPRLLGSR